VVQAAANAISSSEMSKARNSLINLLLRATEHEQAICREENVLAAIIDRPECIVNRPLTDLRCINPVCPLAATLLE
jgi:hypothetical protein